MQTLLYEDETYAIRGALYEVYKTMGNRWKEEVYQQCLELELEMRKIPYSSKRELPIFYKGLRIEKTYVPDLICHEKIIVELKSCACLTDEHRKQLLNYLRITKMRLGLLVNFGAYPKVEIERYAV